LLLLRFFSTSARMTTSTTDRFSVLSSEQLQYNWVDFLFTIWLHNFDTGKVLCYISVVFYLIHFKPQRQSYNGYSIYIPSFIQLLLVVYPVGMTDLRPFFTQKINHNSVNLNHIPTTFGTEMRFNEPFMCTKFQLNRSMCSQVMAKNAKCAKGQRKNKIILKFCLLVSWGWLGTIYFKFGK